jgi:cysteine-rich repeat protein
LVARTEACDDGNLQDNDGCSKACRIEQGMTCGEQPSVCTPTTCGDAVQQGTETCDDGNAQPGDGCNETCALEPSCDASMQDCEALCGDGVVILEECDDQNTIDGDGCSSACSVEAGFECATSEGGTSQCTPVCGDGVLSAGEQCDDGINDGGYGECGPDCTLSEYCGDGIINGNEECDLGPDAGDGCEGCRATLAR